MFSKLNGSKWVLAILVPLLAAAAGYGVLKSDVRHAQEDIHRVETQVDQRLERIEAKVDRLLERDNP